MPAGSYYGGGYKKEDDPAYRWGQGDAEPPGYENAAVGPGGLAKTKVTHFILHVLLYCLLCCFVFGTRPRCRHIEHWHSILLSFDTNAHTYPFLVDPNRRSRYLLGSE